MQLAGAFGLPPPSALCAPNGSLTNFFSRVLSGAMADDGASGRLEDGVNEDDGGGECNERCDGGGDMSSDNEMKKKKFLLMKILMM